MSLVVDLIQEDTPKIIVSTPAVIEGEIKQGYEQVTGFQNIFSSYEEKETEKQNKHSHQSSSGNGHKNQRSSIEDPDAYQQTPNNGMCSFDIGRPISNNNNSKVNLDRKLSRQSYRDTQHLRENGYLVENESGLWHQRNSIVSAPKAPGRIWTSQNDDTDIEHKDNPSFTELRRQSSKRKPLYRQDAKELEDLSPEADNLVLGNKRSFDYTCL